MAQLLQPDKTDHILTELIKGAERSHFVCPHAVKNHGILLITGIIPTKALLQLKWHFL
jgi:ABC-type dipeptide/oligopeptide/nickel transport system permease component